MDHRERFFATLAREAVDRPASFMGLPTTKGWTRLEQYFQTQDHNEIRAKIGEDLYPIDMPYEAPNAHATCVALQFAKQFENTVDERTLTAPGFFEDYDDPADVERFDWPDPERYIHRESVEAAIAQAPAGYPILGVLWAAEMYKAVDDRITQFYLRANELYFEYAKGKIDAVLIGNDLGSQRGLILSKAMIDEFVMPNAKKLIEQAHAYGAKVIYHSCGSIFDAIPSLIDAGVDAIRPVQALAKDMDAEKLQRAYGGKVSFCGGVDTQDLLVKGTPEEVRAVVRHLRTLFPTGLIISPSHEAIQEDVSTENLLAIFEEANKIY